MLKTGFIKAFANLPGVGGSKIDSNDCSKAFVLLLLLVGKSRGSNEEYEGEEGEHRATHFQLLDTIV